MSGPFESFTSLDPLPAGAPEKGRSGSTSRPTSRPAARRPAGPANWYDASRTSDENRNHWAGADALGPNAANSAGVRTTLRSRSRYEADNNGYNGGLIRGRADATIGVCPRLQLTLPESYTDPDFDRPAAPAVDADREVEIRWCDWADAVNLADKLRVMDMSETREGEVFGVFITNPKLPQELTPVQLDLKVVEADQCATPDIDPRDPLAVDGIRFDQYGNAVEYHFLTRHPGEVGYGLNPFEYERYAASRVIHLYDPTRASQARGTPAFTAGLPLYAIMRRYTLASLGAAELAAMIAGVIENPNAPIGDETADAPEFEAMDAVPFARNALLTLAGGQTAKAFKSEQPAPSYREFKAEVLSEAGRSINAPRNVSTGTSHEYNYSSGRLDHLPWHQSIRVRRDRRRRIVLDRIFRAWIAEAVLIPNFLPPGLPPVSAWRWRWQWDGFGSIDPLKDATANQIKLESGQTTLERVAAESGEDWEEILQQQAREKRMRDALGLTQPVGTPTTPVDTSADVGEATDE